MTSPAPFSTLPLSSITPEGWIRSYLIRQKHGLTGHLEHAGYPFNTIGWAGETIKGNTSPEKWWPYEQVGYWIDGLVTCGHLLGDADLLAKARTHIKYTLDHADADGFLGPKLLKEDVKNNRWAHVVYFRALMAEHSATGDKRIPRAIANHYLNCPCPYKYEREFFNVEAMLWAYRQTGNERLKKLAIKTYVQGNNAQSHMQFTEKTFLAPGPVDDCHGVTYLESAKLGAIMFMFTGDKNHLSVSQKAFKKIDLHHMMVDGVPSSSERLKGRTALDLHETCDIADYMWSAGYLLMATGDATYADSIERACFNAAPASVKKDFKALQYFSSPNQIIVGRNTSHNHDGKGGGNMVFGPNPHTQCCPGAVNRIMPNYAARMWMCAGIDTLVAALYGPGTVTNRLGGQDVTVVESTQYPFSERIDFEIRTASPAKFSLKLRIPGWCDKAQVLINGAPIDRTLTAGTFTTIQRTFSNTDRVTLILPMEIKFSRWPEGGLCVERGPLVYALGIQEIWKPTDRCGPSDAKFPAYELFPDSDWNFALSGSLKQLRKQAEVVLRATGNDPWTLDSAPVLIRIPARRLRKWKMIKTKKVNRLGASPYLENGETKWRFSAADVKGDFLLTPPLPTKEQISAWISSKNEMITLVPYGATHLRIGIFPWYQG